MPAFKESTGTKNVESQLPLVICSLPGAEGSFGQGRLSSFSSEAWFTTGMEARSYIARETEVRSCMVKMEGRSLKGSSLITTEMSLEELEFWPWLTFMEMESIWEYLFPDPDW